MISRQSQVWYVPLMAGSISAAVHTVIGAGIALAEQIAAASGLVQSAKQALINNARGIQDLTLRNTTLDAIANPSPHALLTALASMTTRRMRLFKACSTRN